MALLGLKLRLEWLEKLLMRPAGREEMMRLAYCALDPPRF